MHEADLEDCGYTMGQVRFRSMDDSFFILVRNYVRVDGVRVRVLDTRLYHNFQSNYILRQFTHKEADFAMLRKAGF